MRDFLWRFWYAADRGRLALALIALAILLVLRLRVFRVLVPAVIGGIVVVGWLLYNPTPLVHSPQGPLVKNGVAAVVVCGNKRDAMRMYGPDFVPEPQTGTWSLESEGTCDILYHHPPDPIQRENRQERAAQERS